MQIEAIRVNKPVHHKAAAIFDWVFKNIFRAPDEADLLHDLQEDVYEFSRSEFEVVFYPSSGYDISDIIFFEKFHRDKNRKAKLFIHNDPGNYCCFEPPIAGAITDISNNTLNVLDCCHFILHNLKSVLLVKIQNINGDIYWLLHFSEQDNEEFLKRAISEKWRFDCMYSANGWQGMKRSDTRERKKCIPDLLYLYMMRLFRFKLLISNNSVEKLLNIKESYFENLKDFANELPEEMNNYINEELNIDRKEFCKKFSVDDISEYYDEEYFAINEVYLIS
jgi:hypothetical protein